METKKVIAWAYWVGEESKKAWQQNRQALSRGVNAATSIVLTPLGAFAAGTLADLILPKLGDNIKYGLVDWDNLGYFMDGEAYSVYNSGNGVAGYQKVTGYMCQGTYYITLLNDNITRGLDVNVKVSALIERKTYKDFEYTDVQSSPI